MSRKILSIILFLSLFLSTGCNRKGIFFSNASPSLAPMEEKVYFLSEQTVFCFDGVSSAPLWPQEKEEPCFGALAVFSDDNMLYTAGYDLQSRQLVLRRLREDGEPEEIFRSEGEYQFPNKGLFGLEGGLFYYSSGNRFYSVSLSSGKVDEKGFLSSYTGIVGFRDGTLIGVSLAEGGEGLTFPAENSGTAPLHPPQIVRLHFDERYPTKEGIFSLLDFTFTTYSGEKKQISLSEEICYISASEEAVYCLTQGKEQRSTEYYRLYQISGKGLVLLREDCRLVDYRPYEGCSIEASGKYLLIGSDQFLSFGKTACFLPEKADPGDCKNRLSFHYQYLYDIKADALYLVSVG